MAPEVRLNGPENEPLGIVPIQEALRMAGDLDVDLVEIVATANPPVCRLMDYGKFKYLEQKKAAEAKAKQTVIEIKEVKFRPATDDGDYNIKMRNIRRFLGDGDKVKVTLRFRGREITHQELGLALLNRVRDDLADGVVVEQFPKLEGRQMIMMLAPARKKPAVVRRRAPPPRPAARPLPHRKPPEQRIREYREFARPSLANGQAERPANKKWLGALKGASFLHTPHEHK